MIKAVLFDLDGTLADTARDLGAALNAMLAEHGLPLQPYEAMRPIASHGARALIKLGFGIEKEHPDFPALRARFMDEYENSFDKETVLFDGVNELIVQLAERGLPWGIITNKPERFTARLVETLAFPAPPAVIVSGDTTPAPKPDPRPMLHATNAIGIAPEHCVYVGDAERDIEAGRVTGMRTLIANWGYIADDDVPHAWRADAFIDHPLDVLKHLD